MDQPAIVIRPAALGDLAAITEIYAEAVRTGTASFEIEPPAREEMERRYGYEPSIEPSEPPEAQPETTAEEVEPSSEL